MPTWRLSLFYFCYFASVGALIPYWNSYLQSTGFSDAQIGELVALLLLTKVVAPNVWGWIADHTGRRVYLVRIACLLGLICFAGVFAGSSYAWMALVMLAFGFFWNAALPQLEATTLTHVGEHTYRYNYVRIWGSIGFIVSATLTGYYLEWASTTLSHSPGFVLANLAQGGTLAHSVYAAVPWIVLSLCACIWLASLLVPEQAVQSSEPNQRSLTDTLCTRPVVYLLGVVFLVQVSHGPYYVYFTRYLLLWGYGHSVTAWLWTFGVIGEIGVFLLMYRWLRVYGTRNLLLIALILTTLRWTLIAWLPDSLWVLIFAQVLHAASYGMVHTVAVTLIHRYFTGTNQGRGQALYSSIGFGLGGAVGSLLSGYVWERMGGRFLFGAAAVIAAVGLYLVWKGVEPAKEPNP